MELNKINDEKIYELVLQTKWNEEKQRDEINKYYISLFTGILAALPIIEKFTSVKNVVTGQFSEPIKVLLSLISFVGIAIAISWLLTLKRVHNYIKGLDSLLMLIEERNDQYFVTYMKRHMDKTHSPGRITKQVMLVPIVFLIIFILTFLYTIGAIHWLQKFL